MEVKSIYRHSFEKGFDVRSVDCAEGAEAESVGGADLARIDGKAVIVAVVVYTLEIPVRVIGIKHAHHQTRLQLTTNDILETKFVQSLVDGLEHTAVTGELGHLSFSKVFLQCLTSGIDGLNWRREVHLACAFEVVVLQVKVAII